MVNSDHYVMSTAVYISWFDKLWVVDKMGDFDILTDDFLTVLNHLLDDIVSSVPRRQQDEKREKISEFKAKFAEVFTRSDMSNSVADLEFIEADIEDDNEQEKNNSEKAKDFLGVLQRSRIPGDNIEADFTGLLAKVPKKITDVAPLVNEHGAAIKHCERNKIFFAQRIGYLLVQAKQQCKNGGIKFEDLKKDINISRGWLGFYIQLHKLVRRYKGL